MALRSADSRIEALANRARRRCASNPGNTMASSATSGMNTSTPPISQNTNRNSRKNGRSASTVAVLDVIRSRIDSSSRNCEMNEPVDFGRTELRRRRAWP
ncbi:hypothetical protein D3C72_2051320 [compost metagenome]